MPAYCLFQNIEITDIAKMEEYATRVLPITQSFGGSYVARTGKFDVVEGDWSPTWPVIIVFPSLARAHAWYESEAYAPLKALRKSAGRFSAVFIDGDSDEG